MSDRPTAGQASLEYVAALALIAAVFVVAAPAVGAPDIPRLVVHKLRLGICVVASDVCSDQAAKAAGLAPCPMRSDTKGRDVSVSAVLFDVGHRWMITVTSHSDGTVSVVRVASGHGGVTGGTPGGDVSVGPVKFNLGMSGAVRARLLIARGWQFPDQATADRFLGHARLNTINERDFPAAWHTVEGADEIAAMAGLAAGAKGYRESGQLAGLGGSTEAALGARLGRGGVVTLYGRFAFDGEASLPFLPSPWGHGRQEWVVEYTFGRGGPREIAFRRADPSDRGNRVTETVMRLDLRDPENLAVAQPLIATRLPWPPAVRDHVDAVMRRIGTHGTVERTVSEVDDESIGISGSVRAGVKIGASAKRVRVHKQLLEAGARTGGPYERERFDCTGQIR